MVCYGFKSDGLGHEIFVGIRVGRSACEGLELQVAQVGVQSLRLSMTGVVGSSIGLTACTSQRERILYRRFLEHDRGL